MIKLDTEANNIEVKTTDALVSAINTIASNIQALELQKTILPEPESQQTAIATIIDQQPNTIVTDIIQEEKPVLEEQPIQQSETLTSVTANQIEEILFRPNLYWVYTEADGDRCGQIGCAEDGDPEPVVIQDYYHPNHGFIIGKSNTPS